MRSHKALRAICLSIVLATIALPGVMTPAVSAQTQDLSIAVQRGYRTGYSDGYMAGYRDTIDSVARSHERHAEYTKADRAFSKDYGTIEDYRDGYQQGFESGYDTGYERRSFEASLPTGLKRRGVMVGDRQNLAVNSTPVMPIQTAGTSSAPVTYQGTVTTDYQSTSNATVIIPRDTELMLELMDDLNTEQSREGERFTAKIVSPSEIAGAIVEGRVSKVLKPGRIKRRSELLLSFDRILLTNDRWSNFSATLTEVMAVKGDNIKRVDDEGTAIGKSSLKTDAIKVGGATGAGALIGGVVGGPVGVAVGAGVGAAFGVGAVVIERGKHVRLNKNQQLRIRTAYETQIR